MIAEAKLQLYSENDEDAVNRFYLKLIIEQIHWMDDQ